MWYKKTKGKKSERSKLISRADHYFSIYIRTRDINPEGYTKCVTCGKYDHWRNLQCGHYWSRKMLSVRWDEINCGVQCGHCNCFCEGNKPQFTIYLKNKYGSDALQALELKAKHHHKYTVQELKAIIEYYKAETKEVRKKYR